MRFLAIALSLALCAISAVSAASYRKLATFPVKSAAFVQVQQLSTQANRQAHPVLVTTAFGPFSGGQVNFIDNPKKIWTSANGAGAANPVSVDGFLWPNSVVPVPESISKNSVLVADGFLVPFKSTGGLYLVEGTTGDFASASPVKLTTDKQGWFYHNATFIDINGDGKLDILTARANKGILSSGGELLWLENPGSVTSAWKEHVIVQGPDVMFQVHEMDGNPNTIDVIASQFFSKKLSAYFFQKSDTSKGYYVDIDTKLGAAYTIEVQDLNGDGKAEFLVSTHENGPLSAIYAYEIPANVNGTWTRHTLADASSFKVIEKGPNQAAPGFAYAFFPKVASSDKKPHILVAGDGSQSAYLMTPGQKDFDYSIETIINVGGVIGSIGIGDVDGDGYVEFFVPNYDQGQVTAFTFSPAAAVIELA